MTARRRAGVTMLILCLCLVLDLGAKGLIRDSLAAAPPQYYLGGLLRISHWENIGSTMSVGGHLPAALRFWVFTVSAGVVAACLIVFVLAWPGLKGALVIAGSLIASGTLSNVIDRLLHDGRVLDFINIGITPLNIMIFNFADVAIALGSIILAIVAVRRFIVYSSRQI